MTAAILPHWSTEGQGRRQAGSCWPSRKIAEGVIHRAAGWGWPAVNQERSGKEQEVAPSITPIALHEEGQETKSKESQIQNP